MNSGIEVIMMKRQFVKCLKEILGRDANKKEKKKAWAAFWLLDTENVRDIPLSWYVENNKG